MRHKDLVRPLRTGAGTTPLISDQMFIGVYKRLTARLTCVQASESLITLTENFAKTFYEKHVKCKEGVMMTGDRVKQIMAIFMFVLRDLLAPEVRHTVTAVIRPESESVTRMRAPGRRSSSSTT